MLLVRSSSFSSSAVVWTLLLLLCFITSIHAQSESQIIGDNCKQVNQWNDLVRLVHTAMKNKKQTELCLEPFSIEKDSASSPLVLNRPIRVRCNKRTNSDDKCQVAGVGHFVRIAGRHAQATISGFTFVGATDCAIRVMATSKQTHVVTGCDFIHNRGTMDGWRGGAIKTEAHTSLRIDSCTFLGNAAAGGGAIFHKGAHLFVEQSRFFRNFAKEGGAVMVAAGSALFLSSSLFDHNVATRTKGGAVELYDGDDLELGEPVVGSNHTGCEGVWDRRTRRCRSWRKETFRLGDLTVKALGLSMSFGLSARILAKAGQRIPLTSPDRTSDRSSRPFHTNPDGAAVFPLDDGGGWMYMSNAENVNAQGGVYGVEFDARGRPRAYVVRLTGTTRNCAGGATPWNTWVSCEEYGRGQCWQVDPKGLRPAQRTKLVERRGGNLESMAYDDSGDDPVFFVTEDHERGALRRFTPSCTDGVGRSWNLLHLPGRLDYLYFTSNSTFEWTPSLEKGRESAQRYYRYTEGISWRNGVLSFVAKRQKLLFRLNLAKGTYRVESTNRGRLAGGGTFGAGPDQLVRKEDYLYVTEDGGGNPGVYVTDGSDYYTLLEARASRYRGDETTGLAFSPDGRCLYVCLQEIGYLFEITRDDGFAFPGNRTVSSLRWHNHAKE